MQKIVSLIAFLALVFVISGVGSYVTMPAVQGWYQHIQKPSWTPPDYVFAPVWTTLYIMIAISGWLVWQKLPTEKFSKKLTSAIMLPYWVQLALNFSWSIIFFGLGQFEFAMLTILFMILAIAINIRSFARVSKPAAWLLVPYLLWVTYASSLNIYIALNN